MTELDLRETWGARVYGACLLALPVAALVDGFDCGLAGYAAWLVLALALGLFLYLQRRGVARSGAIMFSAAACFLVFYPATYGSAAAHPTIFKAGALGIAAVLAASGAAPVRGDRRLALAAVACALLSLASIHWLGLRNEYPGWARWSTGLFWLLAGLGVLAIRRTWADSRLRRPTMGFAYASLAVAVVVVGVGLARTAEAAVRYRAAVASYETRDYSVFAARFDALVEAGQALGAERRILSHAVAALADRALAAMDSTAISAVIAAAVEAEQWSEIRRLYETANAIEPGIVGVRFEYGLAQFETGETLGAMATLAAPWSGPDLVAVQILQVRCGVDIAAEERQRARAYLLDACLFPQGATGLRGQVGEVLPQALRDRFAQAASLYEVVGLLEALGGAVFHPPMAIGSTGIEAPVDLRVYSGGGNTWERENIWVDGDRVSPRGRGYNIALVDPATGALLDTASFDTWENPDQGLRLANYLSRVPYGQIVLGTANDEGSSGLGAWARKELGALGVARFPGYWESHAFIGVKGAVGVEVVQMVGRQDHPVVAGVLGRGTSTLVAGDPEDILAFLQEAAARAPGGFAVYLEGLGAGDAIAGARRL